MGCGWARPALLAASLALGLLGSRCGEEREGRPARGQRAEASFPDTAAAFFARGGVLYGRSPSGPVPLVTAWGEGVARDTLPLAWPPDVKPEAGFVVGDRIAGLAATPNSAAALFWTSGVHSLVGYARLDTPGITVLDFLLESVPAEALWAPVSRYVALLTVAPEDGSDVRLYDAHTGQRLPLPLEGECPAAETCQVVDVRWEGGTLLSLSLQSGEGGLPVPYEVDVADLALPDTSVDEPG